MQKRTIVLIVVACVAGFVAMIGGIIGIVFYATSGVVEAGDRFFAAAGKGDYEAAYALTSENLRRNRSLESLTSFIESNGFDEVADTSWSSRSINNNTGKLEGSVKTRSGGVIPVSIELVHENGEWKIAYFRKQRVGLDDGTGSSSGSNTMSSRQGDDSPGGAW